VTRLTGNNVNANLGFIYQTINIRIFRHDMENDSSGQPLFVDCEKPGPSGISVGLALLRGKSQMTILHFSL